MAKFSKKLWVRVLVPTALIIALILVAIPVLIYTLDTENLRRTLTASLSENTGFKVDFQSMGIDFSQANTICSRLKGFSCKPNSCPSWWENSKSKMP